MIALSCFRRTCAPIDLWCYKGVWLSKMRQDVDVTRQNRGWLSSAAELHSLGIQINASTLSPLFRHVIPLFPSSTLILSLLLLSRPVSLALLLPMNFITARVSAGMYPRTCRCIYACPNIIPGRFPDAYTCILAPLTMRSLCSGRRLQTALARGKNI